MMEEKQNGTTADYVVAVLRRENGYVSGEEISRRLGLSRTAVHTAVKSLRAQGDCIRSVTNRGYYLESAPDLLTMGELAALLPSDRMAHIRVLDEVDSTNRYLRDWAQDGAPDGAVVIADAQTAGRGRLGRRFESPAGCSVYLSVLMRPQAAASVAGITAWTAVAVRRAVMRSLQSFDHVCVPQIKWVNDLILGGKKVCGILTELAIEAETGHIQSVVTGIGVNVNALPEQFAPELRAKAGSLREAAGAPVPRAAFAAALVEELDRMRADYPDKQDEYWAEYRAACATLGQTVLVRRCAQGESSEPLPEARALDITEDFGLRVRWADGREEVLSSGEVSLKPASRA